MKTTRALRELGQSIWLDNITRQLLDSGTLQRYIDELDVTGLTSNPTIFDKAIAASDTYDDQIAQAARDSAQFATQASAASWKGESARWA